MTSQRELDRLLDVYFDDGRDELADRVIDAALDTIDHTRQRRVMHVPWRFRQMTMPLRLATAALIGALVLGGAFLFTGGSRPSTSVPAPSASPARPRPGRRPDPWPRPNRVHGDRARRRPCPGRRGQDRDSPGDEYRRAVRPGDRNVDADRLATEPPGTTTRRPDWRTARCSWSGADPAASTTLSRSCTTRSRGRGPRAGS